jgi:hypothetical protein
LRISNRGWFDTVRIVFSSRKASVGRRFCTPHVGDSSGVLRAPVRTRKLDPSWVRLLSYPTSCPFACQVRPCSLAFIEGHVGEFSPRRSYGKSVARSGLKSVALGLPWVVLPTRISPEWAMRYGDNRLGTFERIACAFSVPSRRNVIFD